MYRKNAYSVYPNVTESVKLILDIHTDPEQHRKLVTSMVAPSYHVWSMSVNAFVSYPTHSHRRAERQNELATIT